MNKSAGPKRTQADEINGELPAHASLDELRELRELLDRKCAHQAIRLIELSRQYEAPAGTWHEAGSPEKREAEQIQELDAELAELRRRLAAATPAGLLDLERKRLAKRNQIEELKRELRKMQSAEKNKRLRNVTVPLPGQRDPSES